MTITPLKDNIKNISSNTVNTLFNGIAIDYATVIPQAAPHIVKSIERTYGDGGPGTIEEINFAEDQKFKLAKVEFIEVNKQKSVLKFNIVEGDVLQDLFAKIEVDISIEEKVGGKSTFNAHITFFAKRDNNSTHAAIKEAHANSVLLFNLVDDYLLIHSALKLQK